MGSSVDVLTGTELDDLLVATEEEVKALQEQGYSLAGGVRYAMRGFTSKAVLMFGPGRDRTASVVPTSFYPVITITSASNEERIVVSRNGSFWAEPPWVLCNDLLSARPSQLDEAHNGVLEQVREVFEPRVRGEEATIEDLAAAFDQYLLSSDGFPSTYGPTSGFGALGSDSRSIKRIERWKSARPTLED
jgi:hypothetical protein